MPEKKHVLVISPHPDDEAIGCGGSIAKHVAAGDEVDVIFLTSGEKGRRGKPEDETRAIRESEAQDAAIILHLSNVEFWRQPDAKVRVTASLVARLVNRIKEQGTSIIYVTHEQESHPDHKAAARLVKQAVRLLNGETPKPLVWMYEIWTPLQKIGRVEDISDFVDLKRRAIQAHKCQCEILRFDVSALSLNRYRGEMHSWPGGEYAEAFLMMKF